MEPDKDKEEEQEDMELEEEGEKEEVVIEVEVGIPRGVKAGQLGKILQLLYLLGFSHNQLGRK